MPVRNGYEVCEYIKKDSRFAHVPVILLVGAFDPLDEREAQRVGADGILKKPFVPPEPLITMVKTLLDRVLGERLVAVSVSKAPAAVQAKASTETIAEAHIPAPAIEEPTPEELSAPAGRVSFGEGDRPVAFGQLLETPTRVAAASDTDVIEPVDDEQILTSSRDATLGEPIFWRNEPPEVEPEKDPSADRQEEHSTRKWGPDEDSLPRREDAALLRPVESAEPLELVHEEPDETLPSVVDSEAVVLDPAAQSPLTVDSGKASGLATNPMEWLATAPQQHSEAASETTPGWDEPIADAANAIGAAEPAAHSELALEPDARTGDEAAVRVIQPSAQTPADTARSVPKHEWAEMTESLEERASELVAQHAASIAALPAQVPAPAQASLQAGASNPPQPSESPAPDPALVEAVVQRILDKMRPQVVDIITKEFLRPVVQALVHREIEKH
jgi:CheY-like chemotaxis protein